MSDCEGGLIDEETLSEWLMHIKWIKKIRFSVQYFSFFNSGIF